MQQQGAVITELLTSVSTAHQRISMHGVRLSLLQAQAQSLGLPLNLLWMPETPSMEAYESAMDYALQAAVGRGMLTSAFGDIFLEDLRQYREQHLARNGMQALFPLWKQPTRALVHDFIESGFKAVLVCVNARYLGREFLGRELNASLLADLPAGVDPCGENGEFHSFVYDGPNFSQPVRFQAGEAVYREYAPVSEGTECGIDQSAGRQPVDNGFWYLDLIQV